MRSGHAEYISKTELLKFLEGINKDTEGSRSRMTGAPCEAMMRAAEVGKSRSTLRSLMDDVQVHMLSGQLAFLKFKREVYQPSTHVFLIFLTCYKFLVQLPGASGSFLMMPGAT